jgi:AcrR family transcriptional regulator
MAKKQTVDREKIIEVAVDLFYEKGYAATSIRDISRVMKISIATLYYYFRDKEDLLFTIVEDMGNQLLSDLGKAKDRADDPLDGLQQMMSRHILLTEKAHKRAKIFVEEKHNLSKKSWRIVHEQDRKVYDMFINQLEDIKKLGIISVDSLPIAAFAIFGMMNWCYRWYKKDGPFSIEDVSDRLINIILNGIINPQQ